MGEAVPTAKEGVDGSFADMHKWVAAVYSACGRHEDSSLGVVDMMTVVEHTLASCLRKASALAPGAVEEWEKAREKDRRQVRGMKFDQDCANPTAHNIVYTSMPLP